MRHQEWVQGVCSLALVMSMTGVAAAQTSFTEQRVPLQWEDLRDVAIGDFNGDGVPDIAGLSSFGPAIAECNGPPGPISCGSAQLLCVSPGLGFGQFGPASCVQTQCSPGNLEVGDFDGDGHLDAVIGNLGVRDYFGICYAPSFSYFHGDGTGGFNAATHTELPEEPAGLAVGDLNEDGRPDAVVTFASTGHVQTYRVTTGGVLFAGAGLGLGTPAGPLAVGDLDGDGHLDAAVALVNQVAILRGNGLGGLAEVERCPTGGLFPQSVVIADLVAGGDPEIAIANSYHLQSSITTMRRDAGSFCAVSPPILPITGVNLGRLAAADLDGDAHIDLAAKLAYTFPIELFQVDAGGQLVFGGEVMAAAGPAIRVGDLDRNGVPDLLTAGYFPTPPGGWGLSALINTTPFADHLMIEMAPSQVRWVGVRGALSYDVVRGDCLVLNSSGGDFTAAVDACIADNLADLSVQIPELPPVGGIWWILVRPNTAAGPGSYDSEEAGQVGSRDAEIAASMLACP